MRRKILCAVALVVVLCSISLAAHRQDQRAKNIVSLFTRVNPSLSAKTAESYTQIILEAGQKYRIDPYVIAALIVHESTVNAHAVSRGGDYGLMQVRWKVHAKEIQREHRVKSSKGLMKPRVNIFFGTRILSECYAKAGTIEGAIRLYSGGNRQLVAKVTRTMRELGRTQDRHDRRR